MRISRLKLQYIREHFKTVSDVRLARALSLTKTDVQEARDYLKLERTTAQRDWILQNSDAEIPVYTGQLASCAEFFRLTRMDTFIALACAVVALVVYFLTLCPTVPGEDGGELITAAYSMGIAHPPGYPLWCILGKLFTTLIPFGNIAWRVNLMSAVFAAATVFVTYLFAVKITRNRAAAAFGAIFLGFSAEFWEQSLIAEVYTLNMFIIALCLFLLLQWYEQRSNKYLIAFAIIYGLGLCNHNTMQFLGPPFVLFVLYVDREPLRRWKLYGTCTILALACLSVYAYLPIRSAANPPADWGNPETFSNFWDVVTRKQYTFSMTKDERDPGRFAGQIGAFFQTYSVQFTPWLCWIPVLGVVALWRKNKFYSKLMIILSTYFVLGIVLTLNFDLDVESIWLNSVFWMPVYLFASVFIASAMSWAFENSARVRVPKQVVIAVSTALLLVCLAINYVKNDKSDYYWAEDIGRNILSSLKPNAIYFPTADHVTFPVLYFHAVENVRPDIVIANKYGYPEESLYKDMPEEQRAGFRKIPNDAEEQQIEDWIIANNPEKPVYFTRKRGFPTLPGKSMIDYGLIYEVVNADTPPDAKDVFAQYTWHTLDPADTRGDLTANYILSDYHFSEGRALLAKKQIPEAVQAFEKAVALNADSYEGLNNIGSACAEAGALSEAIRYYVEALKLDPDYELAQGNLVKVYFQQENYAGALKILQYQLKKHPDEPQVLWMMAQCYEKQEDYKLQTETLLKLAAITPDNPQIYRQLGMAALNGEGDTYSAQRYFAKSLKLDPKQSDLSMLLHQVSMNAKPGDKPGAEQQPGMDDPLKGLMPNPTAGIPDIPGVALPKLPGMPGGASPSGVPNLPGIN